MEQEYEALVRNNTWQLVPFKRQKFVDCKWVFKTKYQADGSVERHKANLVAKGFQQYPNVNVGETFSPMAKITTICIILAIAVSQNWPLKQIDINNAFFNGNLQEEVFMKQLGSFTNPKFPQHVCGLTKVCMDVV